MAEPFPFSLCCVFSPSFLIHERFLPVTSPLPHHGSRAPPLRISLLSFFFFTSSPKQLAVVPFPFSSRSSSLPRQSVVAAPLTATPRPPPRVSHCTRHRSATPVATVTRLDSAMWPLIAVRSGRCSITDDRLPSSLDCRSLINHCCRSFFSPNLDRLISSSSISILILSSSNRDRADCKSDWAVT